MKSQRGNAREVVEKEGKKKHDECKTEENESISLLPLVSRGVEIYFDLEMFSCGWLEVFEFYVWIMKLKES